MSNVTDWHWVSFLNFARITKVCRQKRPELVRARKRMIRSCVLTKLLIHQYTQYTCVLNSGDLEFGENGNYPRIEKQRFYKYFNGSMKPISPI